MSDKNNLEDSGSKESLLSNEFLTATKPPRKLRTKKPKRPDAELVKIFWDAPMEAFFSQDTIAPVSGKAIKTLECERWRKSGIPYRKISGRILYRKADVVSYLENHKLVLNTSEYDKREEADYVL